MSRKHRKKGGDPSADWEFVFDGVFGFLSSPLWSVPVMSFIDEKCVVFEPSEENHLEWTSIHKKYSALVEQLLEGYLKDVGIGEQEFMKACMSPSVQRNVEMQMMFEQIFAGEDFEIFKNMMIQRNVELELEALKLVRLRQGKKPSSKDKKPKSEKLKGEGHVPRTEEEILEEVIRRSEEEYKEAQQRRSLQDEEYNETLEKMIAQTAQEAERLEQDVKSKQEETKRAVEESIKNSPTAPPYTPPPEYTPTPQASDSLPEPTIGSNVNQAAEAHPEMDTSQPSPQPPPTGHTDFPSPTPSPTPPQPTQPEAAQPHTTQPKASPVPSTSTPAPSTSSPAKAPLAPVRAPVASPSPPLSPVKGLVEKERLPSIPQSSSDAASQWLQSAKEESAASSSAVGQRVQNNSALSAADMKKREEYLKQQRDRIQKMKNEERSKQLQTYADTTAAERPTATKLAHEALVSGEASTSALTSDEEKQLVMRKMLAEKLKKEVVYKDGGK